MYYDSSGRMKAAGAEADGAAVLAQAEDEGWIKIELYVQRHLSLDISAHDCPGSSYV